MTAERTRVDAKRLTNFSTKVLQKVGVPEDDAQITARILVATDLRGVDSHGVAHLAPFYVKRIKEGLINVKPKIKVFSQAPATATMDGDRGLGFVVGYRAMMEAMHRAEITGAGFVAVRNSTHFGAGANYAMMALSHNMIGISLTTGGKGMVAPGSSGRGVCINVISIAAPAKEESPFILDMATTVVAGGKVEIALREDMTIPEGWVVNREGEPITDPKKFREEGALLPLGGTPQMGSYKGFGLAVAVDILCSILSGSMASPQMLSEPKSTGRCNHFFGALRIDSFLPVENFKKSMDEMIEAFEALPTLPGVKKISVAGGYEAEIEKDRKANGILLNSKVIQGLQELAKELGIEYDL